MRVSRPDSSNTRLACIARSSTAGIVQKQRGPREPQEKHHMTRCSLFTKLSGARRNAMHGGTTDYRRYFGAGNSSRLCCCMLVRLAAFPGSIQGSIQGRIQGSAWPSGCALPPHLCTSFPIEVGCFSKVMIASAVLCIVSWSSRTYLPTYLPTYIVLYILFFMQGLDLLRITAPCPQSHGVEPAQENFLGDIHT